MPFTVMKAPNFLTSGNNLVQVMDTVTTQSLLQSRLPSVNWHHC